MRINLSPQVREERITVTMRGDALTIDGMTFDFTPLPEGAVLPAASVACEHIISDVTRTSGQVVLTLLLPIALDAPHEACFPQPLIDPPDGPLALPGAAA